MIKFMMILICVIILFGCVASVFGLWHLVDSYAAEVALSNIANKIAGVIELFGKGLLILLAAVSVGAVAMGIGGGLRAGAEAFGRGAAFYMLSREMAQQIEAGNVERAALPGGFTTVKVPEPTRHIEKPPYLYLNEGGQTEGM